MYTTDIPVTKSRKFIYAGYIALATQLKDLSQTKTTLTDDLNILKIIFEPES